MSTARKKQDVTEVVRLTDVIDACLGMGSEEREQYLESVKSKDPQIYESAQALLNADDKKLIPDDAFLSALIQMTRTGPGVRSVPKPPTPFSPMEIGKYVLLQELGRGGMAVVYRGKTRGVKGFERPVAIKKILSEHGENDDFRQMFEFEAHLSALLTHPNIVQVFDFFRYDQAYFLVMEYVHGKNILQVLTKLQELKLNLPVDCSIHIAVEILKGLDYAHNKQDDKTGNPLNVVHRDICPRNVMLGYHGSVKIVDFGIAKAINRSDVTQTGALRGTVSYMAPEALDGKELDQRSDVFATSLVLYELIAGKTLFKSPSLAATLDMVRRCEIDPQIDSLPCDDEVKKLLKRGLEKNPEKRYASAEDFRFDLQHYLHAKFPRTSDKRISGILQTLFSDEIQQDSMLLESAERKLELEREARTEGGSVPWGKILIISALVLVMAALGWFWSQSPASLPVPKTEPKVELKVEVKPEVKPEPKKEIPPPQPKAALPPPVVEKTPEKTPEKTVEKQAPVTVIHSRAGSGLCSTLVRTTPNGATLSMDGKSLGTTPFVAQIPCDEIVHIKLEKPGYQDFEKEIRVKKSGSSISLPLKKN